MSVPEFDPKELKVAGEIPATPMSPPMNIYNYPVSVRDGFAAMMNRKPIWQVTGLDSRIFTPRILPDNVARAFVLEARPFDAEKDGGGKDIFGNEI